MGIDFAHPAGDVDLVIYDAMGKIVGSRVPGSYPHAMRSSETDSEYFGLYSQKGEATYYARVLGYKKAQNTYSLHLDSYPYRDGAACLDAGYTRAECLGEGDNGAGLLPFPFPDPADTFVGSGYKLEHEANYRFARRELIMLVRYAIAETMKAFPGTTPLSLMDMCQKDGITPGYDVGEPRHPESTHDQGGNMDIAYFQTDGSNNGQTICAPNDKNQDGYYCTDAAKETHIVDLPRQAFFMGKLLGYSRVRVIGADRVIHPLLTEAAKKLGGLQATDPQYLAPPVVKAFDSQIASGDGWPFHHHHIHLSLDWWGSELRLPPASYSGGQSMFREGRVPASFGRRRDLHR